MPKVTVYIRNEDYENWKKIPEKTDFIHRALRVKYEGLAAITKEVHGETTRAAEEWPEPSKNPLVNGEAYAHGHKAYEDSIIKTKEDAEKAVKPLVKDTPWGGPLFRDKKKSKL